MTDTVHLPREFVDALSASAAAGRTLAHFAQKHADDPLIAECLATHAAAEREFEAVYRATTNRSEA